MARYDPDGSPRPHEWLALGEADRLDAVAAYHQKRRVAVPNPQLHAAIHVVIENQLALGEPVVVETMARLQAEGLDRHEALHAIGSQLAEHLYQLMDERRDVQEPAYARYLERLHGLTAAAWRAS